MLLGLQAALIAYLANSIFLHFAYIRYFWLVMGLAGAASYIGLSADLVPARAAPSRAQGALA